MSTELMRPYRGRRAASGFTLIEIMIAMLLSLISFVIMLQLFKGWDDRKRTSVSGSDAQVSGSIAMFKLERDLRLGGYGFSSIAQQNSTALNCTVNAYNAARAVPTYSFPLLPVEITVPAGNAPHRITVFYGGSEEQAGMVSSLTAGSHRYPEASTPVSKKMDIGAQNGIRQRDRALLVAAVGGALQCDMIQVTNDTGIGIDTPVIHESGLLSDMPAKSPLNNPAGINAAPGSMFVLGLDPQRRIWQIANRRNLVYENELQWVDTVNNATGAAGADGLNDFTIVADNIVDLRAEYGIAPTPAVGGTCAESAGQTNMVWTSTLPSAGCQRFIWAVRVGMLARSEQYEKDVVTANIPTWAGSAAAVPGTTHLTSSPFVPTNIDGDNDNTAITNDWRHYRYRVMEAVIPLKNMMWGSRLPP
jgi:type IV pilus assembly protein PilW